MPKKSLFRRLLPVLSVTLLDTIGFAMMVVLLSYLAKEHLGASALTVGILLAFKQIVLIVSAPVLGRLSDKVGRRPLLFFSLLGTLASHLVLGFAGSLTFLFVGRFLDGISGGNYCLFQTIIGDQIDQEERARAFGLSGAIFGLGFIIGPVVGLLVTRDPAMGAAVLGSIGIEAVSPYSLGFLVAAAFSVLSIVTSALCIPETRAMRAAGETPIPARALKWSDLIRGSAFRSVLILSAIYYLPIFLLDTMFSVHAYEVFSIPASGAFAFLAVAGLVQVIVQAGVVAPLVRWVGELNTFALSFAVMACFLALWGFAGSKELLWAAVVGFAFAAGLLNTVVRSAMSAAAPAGGLGSAFGLLSSLSGVARLIAPVLGGALFELAPWAPGLLGAILSVGGVFAVLAMQRQQVAASRTAFDEATA